MTRQHGVYGPAFVAANGSHASVALGARGCMVEQIRVREASVCSDGFRG